MATCTICGETLQPEQKVCDICGTSVPNSGAVPSFAPPAPNLFPPPAPRPAPPVAAPVAPGATAVRMCPVCQIPYGDDYFDDFCGCGGELVTTLVPATTATPPASPATATGFDSGPPPLPSLPAVDPIPAAAAPVPVAPPGTLRPVAGTICLVVYSDAKQPIHYCALNKDVTLIGRSDPVRGDFPDLDLGELFDNSVSRRISRKHAMVLRSRTEGTYSVRPLGGNTGTQIEKELATPLQDYPLPPGTRLVLGGVVRIKFEVIE